MNKGEIAKIKDPLKKFLAFLSSVGIESDRIYLFADKPSIAVPRTARIKSSDVDIEPAVFIDENEGKVEVWVVSPSSNIEEEWKKLWEEYKNSTRESKEE